MKRNKSIIQKDMTCCYVCGRTYSLHVHEVFYGTANRKKSIKYGCYVALCAYHHNMSNEAVHFNKQLDTQLKQRCQRKFEDLYGHEFFMETFHKNYLN